MGITALISSRIYILQLASAAATGQIYSQKGHEILPFEGVAGVAVPVVWPLL